MVHRWCRVPLCLMVLAAIAPLAAQSASAPPGARTIVYHPRDLVPLRAKLRYTTLIVLPQGEDVIEATCGDKEVWMVNVRGGLVSVKPAKAGSESNLNLVTTSGQVYTFLLTEVSGDKSQDADLTVYLELDAPDGVAGASTSKVCPRGTDRGLPRAGRPGARAGAPRHRDGACRTRRGPHGVSHDLPPQPAVPVSLHG